MASSDAYQRLTDTLWAYGIKPDQAALQAAFEQGPDAAAWVQRHLAPDTLLSRDQLDQYSALEASGRAARLAADDPALLDATQPLDDAGLRAAIDELNRSTAAVARQSEALRQQHDSLARLLRQRAAAADARAAMAARWAAAADAERRALAAAVEGLAQRVAGRVADFEEQQPQLRRQADGGGGGGGDPAAGASRFQATINGLLQSDDRLLASLQKLGQQLEEDGTEAGLDRVREACARLIKHTVEMVRTKLDRTYLEAVEAALDGSPPPPPASADDVAAMEAELEELYTEILPVAQMSTEQQFLEPTMQSSREREASNLARSAEATSYVEGCLDYLLANMSTLAAHVEDVKAYESAFAVIMRTAKAELAAPVPTDVGSANNPTSATRRPNPQPSAAGWPGAGADVSPVKRAQRPRAAMPATGRRRRSSGLGGVPDETPLELVLRDLALSLPDDGGERADAAALDAALRSRARKAADVARDAQASLESAARHHLADSARALAMLRDDVVVPEASAAQRECAAADEDDDAAAAVVGAALSDPDIEASLAVLNQEVDRTADRIRAAEAELRARQAAAASGKRAASKQEEMIRRWGPVR